MKSLRTIAVLVGILFLVATVTFTIGSGQIRSFLSGENSQKSLLIIGVLLEIMCGAAVVGIGVLLFPILKLFHHRFAVGYVIFRSIECVVILIGGMYLLLRLQFMWTLLPEPEPPRMAKTSPRRTSKEMSSRTVFSPKPTVRCSTRMSASGSQATTRPRGSRRGRPGFRR